MTENIPNIVPYFILQYVDQRSGTYRGYIVAANASKNENGEIVYDYKIDTNVFRHGWKIVGKFYALNPLFRPVPTGMNLYCVEHSTSAPMRISSFYKDYDLFYIHKQNCTFFITYGQPTLNTISLYFHNMGADGLFPTFGRHPPVGNAEWFDVKFSPIFVMTSFSQDTNIKGISAKYDESMRFKCLNKKCVPWTDNQLDIYKTEDLIAQNAIPILDCVITCNQNLIENEIDKDAVEGKIHSPKSIFSVVKSIEEPTETKQQDANNAVLIVVVIFSVMLILIVCISVIILMKKSR